MLSFLTPARLAAALGVVTGLSAAVTSLLNVLPQDSAVGRAVMGAAGVLGTVGILIKFLDGQAGWEQLQSAQQHHLAIAALPVAPAVENESAELPGEDAINSVEEAGEVIQAVAANGEPVRLASGQTWPS